MFPLKSLLASSCLIASTVGAQAENPTDATARSVVATVNGTAITLGELIIARARLPETYAQLPTEVLFDGLLDQLIQQQLLADQLGAIPPRVTLALKNEARSLRAGEVVQEIVGSISQESIENSYGEKYSKSTPEWNASHILVESREEADEIIAALAGGADFAELAKEKSTGPSGPNGGDLGWFALGSMVPAFEGAVLAMEEDAHSSEPVETQFGWHVIQLNGTREVPPPALDEVREEILAQLESDAVEAYIAQLRVAAEISLPGEGQFDPALLGDLDLLGE